MTATVPVGGDAADDAADGDGDVAIALSGVHLVHGLGHEQEHDQRTYREARGVRHCGRRFALRRTATRRVWRFNVVQVAVVSTPVHLYGRRARRTDPEIENTKRYENAHGTREERTNPTVALHARAGWCVRCCVLLRTKEHTLTYLYRLNRRAEKKSHKKKNENLDISSNIFNKRGKTLKNKNAKFSNRVPG